LYFRELQITKIGGGFLKKITFAFLSIIFLGTFPVHALSWAYAFVVWNGKVYEVTNIWVNILLKKGGEL